MASNKLIPTSGKAWRKAREDGIVIELFSGNAVRLRPVALDVLVMSGKMPDVLTPYAAKSLWMDASPESIGEQAEQAKGYAELINYVVKAAVMEPHIVDEPETDNEISLEDISFQDKVQIFQLAIQPAEAVRKFRDRQAARMESVRNGKGDVTEAEQPG